MEPLLASLTPIRLTPPISLANTAAALILTITLLYKYPRRNNSIRLVRYQPSTSLSRSDNSYQTQLHHCGGGAYDPNNPTKPVVVVQHQPVSQLQPTFSPQVRILFPVLSHYPDRSKDTSHKLLPALSTVSSTSTAGRKQPAGIHYSAVWLFQVNRSTLPSPWSRMTLKHQFARSRHMNMLLRTKVTMEQTKNNQASRL